MPSTAGGWLSVSQVAIGDRLRASFRRGPSGTNHSEHDDEGSVSYHGKSRYRSTSTSINWSS
jgi:hypothetical protein